jgi:Spy/CpxP family protein refolding chaperone
MKLIVVIVMLMTLLAVTAVAGHKEDGELQQYDGKRQGQGEGRRGGGDRMARMQERLGLSDDQVIQMKEIRESGGSRKDMRAVLTEDQRAQIDAHRAQRKNQGGEARSHGQPPGEAEPPADFDES